MSKSSSPSFADLLDDAAFLSLEHQLRLEDVVGQHDWHVDLQQPRFRFTGAQELACTGVHLLGSAAPGPGSWLWAWANPSGYPEAVTALSAAVRDFGREHGIPELAEPEVPFGALPGAPDHPRVVAALMTEAAKAVAGRWTSYTAEVGSGTHASFMIEHPDFALPAAEGPRVMRVIQEGLSGLPLRDVRRALYSYGVRRGLTAEFDPSGSRLDLSGTAFQATVGFDEQGRVSTIDGKMSGGEAEQA
ncbi:MULTISPECIES: DUF6882 domain-containing protein [Nocardiopsis]|uniref:DUF6882 domain-containing protein n=1 Tax=Nocardiopsis TaxID=2013 RepID=UPI00034B9BD8|nr:MULTISPECIES: DUF6882 domain-containing protein [Nocardiopsis]